MSREFEDRVASEFTKALAHHSDYPHLEGLGPDYTDDQIREIVKAFIDERRKERLAIEQIRKLLPDLERTFELAGLREPRRRPDPVFKELENLDNVLPKDKEKMLKLAGVPVQGSQSVKRLTEEIATSARKLQDVANVDPDVAARVAYDIVMGLYEKGDL